MGGIMSNTSGKGEDSNSTLLRASSRASSVNSWTSSPSSVASSSPGWRQIVDDPRSPSAGIDRTPIIVGRPEPETTPEVNLVDPRSPTVGIVRTPLQLGAQPQDHAGKLAGQMDTLTLEERAEDKEDEEQEEADGGEDAKTDTPDPMGLSLSEVDESSCLLPAGQQERPSAAGWRTSTQSCLKAAVQPKQLFQCGDLSPILAAPSPSAPPQPPQPRPLGLKPLDTNSPRAVVQRKAIRKVEANRQNFPDHPARGVVANKENW